MATTNTPAEEIKDGPIGDNIDDETPVDFADSAVDTTGFEEAQIGFPPYFKPNEGRTVKFRPVALDTRDARFFRWVAEASHNIACWTGPKDDAEPVLVHAGEYFTLSVYASLPLEKFIGEEIICTVKTKRDIHDGQTVWVWSVKVKPETKQRLELAAKAKMEKQLAESGGTLENVYNMAQQSKMLADQAMKEAKRTGGGPRLGK
jgi:hypothetical protein